MGHRDQHKGTSRRHYRFGILGLFGVLFVILLAAVVYWVVAAGFREAIQSTGFQYLGLAAIIAGLGTATRVTARLLENGAIADKRDVTD
jgi:ABC-type transporter Mla subunit MlaD